MDTRKKIVENLISPGISNTMSEKKQQLRSRVKNVITLGIQQGIVNCILIKIEGDHPLVTHVTIQVTLQSFADIMEKTTEEDQEDLVNQEDHLVWL